MTDRDRVERSRVATDEMRLEFIRTELELGSTLLDLARTELNWESGEEADEVLSKADKACRGASEQLAKAKLRDQATASLEGSLLRLQSEVAALRAQIEQISERKPDRGG